MTKTDKIDYNNIPVFYCKSCLGLCIVNDDGIGSYCKDCGSISVGRSDFQLWEESYKSKYGHDFLGGLDEECECS